MCISLFNMFSPLNNMSWKATSLPTYAILSWNHCVWTGFTDQIQPRPAPPNSGCSNCPQISLLKMGPKGTHLCTVAGGLVQAGTAASCWSPCSQTHLVGVLNLGATGGLEPLKSYSNLPMCASVRMDVLGRGGGSTTLTGFLVFRGPHQS